MMFFPNLDPVDRSQPSMECTFKTEQIRNQIDEVIGFMYTCTYNSGEWYSKVCDLSNSVYYYEDSYKRIIVKNAL